MNEDTTPQPLDDGPNTYTTVSLGLAEDRARHESLYEESALTNNALTEPPLIEASSAPQNGALRLGWLGLRLPGKLLLLTVVFVMLTEVLIFLPSIAAFRISWLNDRLTAAYVASLAAEAVPGGAVPAPLRNELLRTALVRTVALRRDGQRRLVLPPVSDLTIDAYYDLRPDRTPHLGRQIAQFFDEIGSALAVFAAAEDRTLRIVGPLGPRGDDIIEIVVPEAPLRRAMIRYGLNILSISIIISLVTAAFVYVALSRLLVQPMTRLTRNMLRFSKNPEDPDRIIVPSERADEVGIAERQLAHMQRQLVQHLTQKNRLAQLGLAVSKINHDLRNMLAHTQLISDRLTAIRDPAVQIFAPKLIASLDRAINFCNESLKFGRVTEASPRRNLVLLKPLVEEVGDGLGLPRDGQIAWAVDIDPMLRIDADPDHLFRVLSNLCRNAIQAIESFAAESPDRTPPGTIKVMAWRENRHVFIEVRDTGPGVPPRARAHLFRAFQASSRKGGSGLGLAIASELVFAHGGELRLLDTEDGAAFLIDIPDRSRS